MKKISESLPVHRRKLMTEIMFLSIFLTSLIIVAVQLGSLLVISSSMTSNLKKKAMITADETVIFLLDPLYTIDDAQAIRIGEALLSSGRIAGIHLVSTASGLLLDTPISEESPHIPPIVRDIVYQDMFLGTVTLHFSNSELSETHKRLSFIAMIVVAASILANFLMYRYIIFVQAKKPLELIFAGIKAIADGKYEDLIQETEFVDVNSIIRPMNAMAKKVSRKNFELREANILLEERVGERTAELQKSLTELHQTQANLVASEKLSTLGYLSAGMAHELNTPLGAIISSNRLLIDYLEKKQSNLINFLLTLDAAGLELYQTVLSLGMKKSNNLEIPVVNRKKIKEIAKQLELSGIPNSTETAEYLVDLGLSESTPELMELLDTGKNTDILSFAAEPIISRRMAEIVDVAAHKAANVISALRSYLNPEVNEIPRIVDVDRDIEQVLLLMNNMLKHGIQVQCEFSGVQVLGSSEKLAQVWLNLIRNAAQAMEFKGRLIIRTEKKDGWATVSVIDSGPGIPASIRDRIFEPFFTTKKEGEGMGIGLDICRRIIGTYNGTISVTSQSGFTEFTVRIPSIEGDQKK